MFLLVLFVFSVLAHEEMLGGEYEYPAWSITVGWVMTGTTVSCIPLYIVYKMIITPGSFMTVSRFCDKNMKLDSIFTLETSWKNIGSIFGLWTGFCVIGFTGNTYTLSLYCLIKTYAHSWVFLKDNTYVYMNQMP